MAKLVKHKYYTSKGEGKVFSYNVAISKTIIQSLGWSGEEQIKVYAKNGKIIIEKEG